MPGVNPALLASLSGSPAQPAPGGEPGAGHTADTEPDIHTAYLELHETLKAAVQMATDLQSRAEMEDGMDPKAEKAIAQATDMLTKAEALLAQVEGMMGAPTDEMGAGDSGDMQMQMA